MATMQQYYRPEKRFNVPKEVNDFINQSLKKIKRVAKKYNIQLNEKQEYRLKTTICDTYNYYTHVSSIDKAESIEFRLLEIIPQQDNKIFFNYEYITRSKKRPEEKNYEGVTLRPSGSLKATSSPAMTYGERYLPDNFQF